MAFTIDDFNKIWASTSPLTPYEFSENNYKQGWNFVGATPPSRQMWDFLQKNNDEKSQWLYNNKLDLSGGTMTGAIIRNGIVAKNSVDNSYTEYLGGTDETSSYIAMYGKNHPTNQGQINIMAYDGTNSSYLVLKPNGSMTWGGSNVMTNPIAGLGARQISVFNNRQTGKFTISEPSGTWGFSAIVSFSSPTNDAMNRIFICRGYWTGGSGRTSYASLLPTNSDGAFTVAIDPNSDTITFTVTSIGGIIGTATILSEDHAAPVTFTWTPE